MLVRYVNRVKTRSKLKHGRPHYCLLKNSSYPHHLPMWVPPPPGGWAVMRTRKCCWNCTTTAFLLLLLFLFVVFDFCLFVLFCLFLFLSVVVGTKEVRHCKIYFLLTIKYRCGFLLAFAFIFILHEVTKLTSQHRHNLHRVRRNLYHKHPVCVQYDL